MKKTTFAALLLMATFGSAIAQVPVTSGLKLHLDAANGYNANGTSAATWTDLSGSGNTVTAGNATTAEPTYTTNAYGTNIPGVIFDGTSDYMTRFAASTSGLNSTEATLFVVRIGNTSVNTNGSNYRTTVSIGEGNSFNNEFALMGDWAIHCTASGVWLRRDHQCYPTLPNNLPAIVSGVLKTGVSNNDIDFYVNGIKSTNSPAPSSSPSPYTAASRSIVIGGRYDGSYTAATQSNTWFSGAIMEVLAYNRVLTQTEVDAVHEYLRCKYKINYESCNTPLVCDPIEPCNDKCYWRVVGNNINNGDNIFGTLTSDNIRVQTTATDRGVIRGGSSVDAGFLGWNTMSPTARLHVNCAGGDEESGNSDIRFENLESGTGSILAIDDNGYVYNTGIAPGGSGGGTSWDVTGNTITGGNNFFGTNSPDDVILRTNGGDKGILTSGAAGDPNDDGRLGWQTLTPTAHLHINCEGGNPEDGSNGSDVRFERLEPGHGNILVIDDEGYVYDSRLRLEDVIKAGDAGVKITELQNQVQELQAQVRMLAQQKSTGSGTVIPQNDGSKLFQNAPNPFGKETMIEYYVQKFDYAAYIMVYDLNGRTIAKYPVQQKGKGSITVSAENMVAGVYLYSLVIDGTEIDSKRMIINK